MAYGPKGHKDLDSTEHTRTIQHSLDITTGGSGWLPLGLFLSHFRCQTHRSQLGNRKEQKSPNVKEHIFSYLQCL